MKCINDTFQRPSRRICQIRHIHIPTSCNSRIYGSRFVIQVLQVLYTRTSYFMWLEFPFFCRDSDTILLAYFAPPFPRPTLSFFQFYFHAYVSSRLSSKVETWPRCLLLINHLAYTCTPPPPTHTHTQTRELYMAFYGLLNINISHANEKLRRLCVYAL